MKKFNFLILTLICMAMCMPLAAETAASATPRALKVGMVNFRDCVAESKLGKQEQAAFEIIKKKMESVVEEKEKELNEIADKLNDPDQLDLMSPEAETELKRKFRNLNQEMTQLQSQYYQSLNQTNFKIVQKLADTVAEASEQVAKEHNFDLLVNDESIFYYKDTLDVTPEVVRKMDKIFDEEAKNVSPTKS